MSGIRPLLPAFVRCQVPERLAVGVPVRTLRQAVRGLLFRRYVMPSELRLIGKESNASEATQAGLIGDWGALMSTCSEERLRTYRHWRS
jgi:hypothetical protein